MLKKDKILKKILGYDLDFKLDINDKDFKDRFPLHHEAIKLLNTDIKVEPFLAFFEGSKNFQTAFTSKNYPYSKEGLRKAYFIGMTLERLESDTLMNFVVEYAHELGHVNSIEKSKYFSNESMEQILTSLYSKNIINIFIKGVIAPATQVLGIYEGKPLNGTALAAGLYASTCLVDLPLLKARNYFFNKMEHKADLFEYNKTGVLPTSVFKLYREDMKKSREAYAKEVTSSLKLDKKNVITRITDKAIDFIGSYLMPFGEIEGKHPEDKNRDNYVLKHGNSNPNSRLLELFKIDEMQRRERALS